MTGTSDAPRYQTLNGIFLVGHPPGSWQSRDRVLTAPGIVKTGEKQRSESMQGNALTAAIAQDLWKV